MLSSQYNITVQHISNFSVKKLLPDDGLKKKPKHVGAIKVILMF